MQRGRRPGEKHLFASVKQELSEAFRLLLQAVDGGEEAVRQEGQLSCSALFSHLLYGLTGEVDQVGLVGRLPRQPHRLMILEEQLSYIRAHHCLQIKREALKTGGFWELKSSHPEGAWS